MLTKPLVWKMALLVAPRVTPFPLPTYLSYHFSKLRRQSEEVIAEFRALCARHGVDAPNLAVLEETWCENRPSLDARSPENAVVVAGGEGLVADSEITPVPQEAPALTAGLEEATDAPLPSVEVVEEVEAAAEDSEEPAEEAEEVGPAPQETSRSLKLEKLRAKLQKQ